MPGSGVQTLTVVEYGGLLVRNSDSGGSRLGISGFGTGKWSVKGVLDGDRDQEHAWKNPNLHLRRRLEELIDLNCTTPA